jgi:hypothetical protein
MLTVFTVGTFWLLKLIQYPSRICFCLFGGGDMAEEIVNTLVLETFTVVRNSGRRKFGLRNNFAPFADVRVSVVLDTWGL